MKPTNANKLHWKSGVWGTHPSLGIEGAGLGSHATLRSASTPTSYSVIVESYLVGCEMVPHNCWLCKRRES
jgi:hypothetical protein